MAMTIKPGEKSLLLLNFWRCAWSLSRRFASQCVLQLLLLSGCYRVPMVWRVFWSASNLWPLLRLAVCSTWLHVRNAYGVAMIALVLLIVVSCSYLWVTDGGSHDCSARHPRRGFCPFDIAVISLMVNFIPPEKAARDSAR